MRIFHNGPNFYLSFVLRHDGSRAFAPCSQEVNIKIRSVSANKKKESENKQFRRLKTKNRLFIVMKKRSMLRDLKETKNIFSCYDNLFSSLENILQCTCIIL